MDEDDEGITKMGKGEVVELTEFEKARLVSRPIETRTALLVCAAEKRPTRHEFKAREFVTKELVGGRGMKVSYFELVFQCSCCPTDRVWGTESISDAA